MKTVAQAKHYETGVGSLPSQQQGSWDESLFQRSFNRSTTFLFYWQNGRQIMEMIYFGDHGPSAPGYTHNFMAVAP